MGEVTQPAEATGTELRFHGRQAAFLLHGRMGDGAVGGVGNAQHVSGTTHLKGLEASNIDMFQSPRGEWIGQWT